LLSRASVPVREQTSAGTLFLTLPVPEVPVRRNEEAVW
jgi:hypothetical protein